MAIQSFSATDLITQALRDICELRPGMSTSTDVKNECLVQLNLMLDSWLLDQLMVYAIQPDIYNLTGSGTYTIGPSGADFTADRPTQIEDANIILNTFSPEIRRLNVLINQHQWAAIAVRDITNCIPEALYYDNGFNTSLGYGTIHLWPEPVSGYQLELFTWKQLQEFPDLTTALKFPPGYALAIRKNLAVMIAPAMKIYFKISEPMLELVNDQAVKAKAAIMSKNTPAQIWQCDPGFLTRNRGNNSGWNYSDGTFGIINR